MFAVSTNEFDTSEVCSKIYPSSYDEDALSFVSKIIEERPSVFNSSPEKYSMIPVSLSPGSLTSLFKVKEQADKSKDNDNKDNVLNFIILL
jgi:hypothetical protein